MAKVFAPKPTVPWQPGGRSNPNSPQPDPADGPFIVDYQAADGKAARIVADWTDATAQMGDVEIAWESVYRWIPVSRVP